MAKTKPAAKTPIPKRLLKAKNRKFSTYSDAKLQAALQAIRESGISVREASRRYGIPRATLHDKLSGKSPAEKKKTGPPPLLTVEGEKKIADWVINIAKCGFPITRTDLMANVAKIATDTGKSKFFPNGEPGIRWYKGFLKRYPEISEKEAEGINKARAVVTEESIRSWFCGLRKYIEDNNCQDILEDPSRIFNGDESGFSLCPKTGKVLGPRGWKNLYVIKSGNEKENITVLITFNASGAICPPLVVFPYVRPPKALVDNVPRNWVIGKSDSGWMKGDVFFEYISNDFNSWLTEHEIKRPILLLIDGHKSHMTLPLSEFCQQHNIILYALPPNTTHILQPADVSVFKPMKHEWKSTVKNWQKRPENVHQIITKINFCKVFDEALQNTQMQNHIVKGFRKCGLYPVNPDNVDYTKCVKNFLEKNCQQAASASPSEQALTVKAFDDAAMVIEFISNDLKKYGVNVPVVMNEIEFHKSRLERDSNTIQPSTSTTTSADQTVNRAVGSIVHMDQVTLLPVDIIHIADDMLLNYGEDSWINEKNSELDVFSELESGHQNNDIDTGEEEVTANKSDIAPEQTDQVESAETDESSQDEIVTLAANEKENRNEEVHWGENEIHVEKGNGNEAGDGKENEMETDSGKRNEREIESNKEKGIVIENDNKEDEKGNKEENDKDNKQADQPKNVKESETETEKETYTNNEPKSLALVKETDSNTTVILNNKIYNSTNSEKAQNKEKNKYVTDGNKEASGSSNIEEKKIILDPFQKHLTFPEAFLQKKQGSRAKEKIPSAISSDAWRTYYTRKADEKKEKIEKANLKRKAREEKKAQQQTKPAKRSKRKAASNKKNTKIQSSTSKDAVLCSLCEEELVSDAEDDKDRNIGCDECPRWYHLKCTDLSDCTYDEAAIKDYACHMCRNNN